MLFRANLIGPGVLVITNTYCGGGSKFSGGVSLTVVKHFEAFGDNTAPCGLESGTSFTNLGVVVVENVMYLGQDDITIINKGYFFLANRGLASNPIGQSNNTNHFIHMGHMVISGSDNQTYIFADLTISETGEIDFSTSITVAGRLTTRGKFSQEPVSFFFARMLVVSVDSFELDGGETYLCGATLRASSRDIILRNGTFDVTASFLQHWVILDGDVVNMGAKMTVQIHRAALQILGSFIQWSQASIVMK